MGTRHTNEYNLLVPVILNYDDIQVDRLKVYVYSQGMEYSVMLCLPYP